jgi:E1A-binding protein p400
MYYVFQSVQTIFDVPLNLMVVSPAHLPNWDLVADIVNSCSRVYRSTIVTKDQHRKIMDIETKKIVK